MNQTSQWPLRYKLLAIALLVAVVAGLAGFWFGSLSSGVVALLFVAVVYGVHQMKLDDMQGEIDTLNDRLDAIERKNEYAP